MNFARFARASAVVAAGALAAGGTAAAAPAFNPVPADTAATTTQADVTPVYYGYGPYYNSGYYNGYYAPPPPRYRPYYNPYGYYGQPRGYYAPYGYRNYGYGYRRPHSGLYIRTPGLRLGIGF